MRAKLLQMDRVLRQVVDALEEDDLLIVLGDHGMDTGGDHGGDGVLETSAGLWMYSKTPLRNTAARAMELSLAQQTKIFPGATVPHRRVQQIDLVPTISLLLGLPIPFNNLGAVIPELFEGKDLDDAVAANAVQVGRYLDTYRASASGSELDAAWASLENLRNETTTASAGDKAEAQATYLRAALAACRAMWAQFNSASMALGLLSLAMSLAASAALFVRLGAEGGAEIVGDAMAWSIRGMAAGAIGGTLLSFLTGVVPAEGIDALDWILFLAPFCGALVVIGTCLPPPSLWTAGTVVRTVASTPIVLVLHTVAFFSNSFTFWEDRIILFFLASTLVEPVRAGLAVPSSALRARILRAAGVFAVAARAMGSSTVCREEQQPYCRVTFFASASVAVPPLLVRVLALPVALALPALIRWRLSTAKADHGSAALVLPHALRPALVAGSIYWLLDWADAVDFFGVDAAPLLRTVRTVVAWTAVFFVTMGAAGGFLMPACIKINVDGDPQKPERVTVLGYANAFGAPYLVLWSVALALVWLSSQLTGQLMLALGTAALLAHLELVNALRDARVLNAALASTTPSKLLGLQTGAETPFVPGTLRFADMTPLALLALHAFFATGHQATVPSIQWKPAFMLTPGVSYPLSPMLVALNAFGPVFVIALAAPLLAAWNVAPRGGDAVALGAGRAALALQAYFGALLLGAAGSAAHLRRHLMVWKVFAPRFMLGAATLLAVDTAAILGLLALGPVVRYMARVFGPAVADAVRPA
jgi:phosphatidylinositol glycan class O